MRSRDHLVVIAQVHAMGRAPGPIRAWYHRTLESDWQSSNRIAIVNYSSNENPGEQAGAEANVIRASRLFRERRLPAGAAVVHRVHGRGKVEACRGTLRVVSFASRTAIPVDQALRLGLVSPGDVDAEQITHITMMEVEEATVQCAELEPADPIGASTAACVVFGFHMASC